MRDEPLVVCFLQAIKSSAAKANMPWSKSDGPMPMADPVLRKGEAVGRQSRDAEPPVASQI